MMSETEYSLHCRDGRIRSLDSLWEEFVLLMGGPLAERILEFLVSHRNYNWDGSQYAPSPELLTLIDTLERVIDDPNING